VRVLRIGFVGTRTQEAASMTTFFRDVLGLETVRDTPEWSILQLPTGEHDYAEVYGSDFDDSRLCPPDAGLMVAFVVDDLDGAHVEVIGAGMQASPVVWAAQEFGSSDLEGFGWFFIKATDGNTYVIQQVPDRF
jgi:catechol 2,3-dioxygenase-like lactoylglutathione lyase family enzyme